MPRGNAGNEGLEAIIPLMNKIQNAYVACGMPTIELPSIAVVGSQSAGKSSVLEQFVGRDFLPRGSGICTRRPLLLQLTPSDGEEYGVFLHNRGQKYHNFEDIMREIEVETARSCGPGKEVSNISINLEIFSPNVLNLTLVDLPGMTKVAVKGQNDELPEKINRMIKEYISRPNCIILAVSPANVDIANSDGLEMAKSVDPNGERTIGVITKLDIMDEGTDAYDLLMNKTYNLKRGYVGVINRSQKDIDSKRDINDSINAEKIFFESHPKYSRIKDRMGAPFLQKVLNKQLSEHIRAHLPDLKLKLESQFNLLDKDIANFGHEYDLDDPEERRGYMLHLVAHVARDFVDSLFGQGDVVTVTELSGGAIIKRLFVEQFPSQLGKVQFNDRELSEEIVYAIKNITALGVNIFTPDKAFELVTRCRIKKFLPPSLSLLDKVNSVLMIQSESSINNGIPRYTALANEMRQHLQGEIRAHYTRARKEIELQSKIQLAHINTNHEDFVNNTRQNEISETDMIGGSRFHKDKNNAQESYYDQQRRMKRDGPRAQQGPTGKVVKELNSGYLKFMNGGLEKPAWFKLNERSLVWFTTNNGEEKLGEINIVSTIRYRKHDRPNTFVIFKEEGIMYNELAEMIFMCPNADEFSKWNSTCSTLFSEKNSDDSKDDSKDDSFDMSQKGIIVCERDLDDEGDVVTERFRVTQDMTETANVDIKLTNQVNIIRLLVESYTNIIYKVTKDIVPKTIMCMVCQDLKELCQTRLFQKFLVCNVEEMMAEDEEAIQQRTKTIAQHAMLQQALKLMKDMGNSKLTDAELAKRLEKVNFNEATAASRLQDSKSVSKKMEGVYGNDWDDSEED